MRAYYLILSLNISWTVFFKHFILFLFTAIYSQHPDCFGFRVVVSKCVCRLVQVTRAVRPKYIMKLLAVKAKQSVERCWNIKKNWLKLPNQKIGQYLYLWRHHIFGLKLLLLNFASKLPQNLVTFLFIFCYLLADTPIQIHLWLANIHMAVVLCVEEVPVIKFIHHVEELGVIMCLGLNHNQYVENVILHSIKIPF